MIIKHVFSERQRHRRDILAAETEGQRDRDRGMEQWMGAANPNLGSSVMLSRRVDLTEFLVSGESCIQWPVIFFRSKTPANCLTSGDCALRT
jgi:hypothetical protein